MFTDKITLFNFHERSGNWYAIPLAGVDLGASAGSSRNASSDRTGADTVTLLVNCSKSREFVAADGGRRSYLPPKEYASCDDPENRLTFAPERDFFLAGDWDGDAVNPDEDEESGFYHRVNHERDGVYMVTSASFFPLLPHFEVGGR